MKGVMDGWVLKQLRQRRKYVREIALTLGVNPDDASRDLDAAIAKASM